MTYTRPIRMDGAATVSLSFSCLQVSVPVLGAASKQKTYENEELLMHNYENLRTLMIDGDYKGG